jgi:uncharacterized repeat protein (TIGR01451 family)
MSEPVVTSSSVSFNKIYRVLACLGLVLILIPALLFTFSSRTLAASKLAAPSDTTISQRIQNTVTSGTTITGTYGEILTATMRFTVTAGTMLTGPITITTRFNGYTPANQLGFRFLGQQGAIADTTVAPGTPALATNSFTYTVGNTTYLTWTFSTIDNTSGGVYVYEIPYQIDLVWDGTADPASTNIPNPANNTKIVWSPGGAGNTKTANSLTVNRLKPDLSFSAKAARATPAVQGGATVVYTVTIKNGNTATGFSTAYDLLVTDTLDSRLTYVGASPAPSVTGNLLTWTTPNWSLAPNTTWVAYVTATLPITIPANTNYSNTVASTYSTLFGVVSDEGYFTSTTTALVSGGLIGSKQGSPTTNIRIGDSVTYTVRMTVSQSTYLNAPVFTDTLPLGLHYQSGSFSFSGGATLSGTNPITATSGANELLIWKIQNISVGAAKVFTASYVADVTGLNASGVLVHTSPGTTNIQNSVIGGWQDNSGTRLSLSSVNTTVQLAQPNLNNVTFGLSIPNWIGTPVYEVGSTPVYKFSLANTGIVTAYEVVISLQLPSGVSYQGNLGYPPALQLVSQPTVGDTGILQFIIKEMPKSSGTVDFSFNTKIENSATPGNLLTAQLGVVDYSSQPGGQYDGIGDDTDNTGVIDRHYGAIPAALPAVKTTSFVLRGLTAIKTSSPTSVQPGQLLTYSILYSNTSAVYTSTNVQIMDTYDSLLTYLSSTSSPNAGSVVTGANTLTWNVGTLNPNPSASSRITATFQVATGIDRSVRMLTNTITSDSNSPAPAVSRIVTTTLVQPKPTINLDDKNITATAGSFMTYTMIYSNAAASTGATTGTFTVTLNYATYLSFTNSTGRTPVAGSGGTIFTDTLGAGISRTVRLRMLVAQPLPYDLVSFTSTATIAQPAIDISDSESENTPVNIPIFTLVKVNTSPGNPAVGAGATINYLIYVTNTGIITANNLVITDVWDANTSLASGTGWTVYGTYAVITVPVLAPGAGVQLSAIAVNVTTTLPNNAQVIRNTAHLSSRDTTSQTITYDTPLVGLYIQKSHTPDPAYPSELLTYTIVYTAYSPSIGNPVVTDTLPAGVTYVSCSGATSCSPSSGKVVWSWPGGLLAGDNGNLTLVVLVHATEWITLTNTYASNASGGATYRDGTPDLTYVGRPHLSLTKKAATAVTPIAPGDYITYTLTYTNAGSYKSTGTLITDTLPAQTTFQSCAGASCVQVGSVVSWTVGEVPITTTGLLTMVVRVNPGAGNTIIANTAYRISADRNVVGEVAPTSVNITVVRPALAVTKSVSPSWISLGGSVTYTVRYTNTGGGTFTQLYFTDTLDARTSFHAASGNCAHTGELVGGTVTCAGSNLSPNQSGQFTITVDEDSLGNGDVVTNAVSYRAANQTEVLPKAMSNVIEVPASNTGAAADFVGVPTSGPFPLNVVFTNMSSGNLSGATYLWDFGDSQTSPSSASTVTHTYSLAGVYTVSLKITTGLGGNTRVRTSYITAGGTVNRGVNLTTTNPAKYSLYQLSAASVTYTLRLTNTGNVPDIFTLTPNNNGWVTTVAPASTGSLSAGGSTTVVVTVTVPGGIPHNSQDVVTIKATSATSSSIQSSVVLTTTVYDPAQGFYLTPSTATKSGAPSQVVVYTLVITNNGLTADSFTLAMSNHGWPTVSSTNSIGPLNFGASASIIVSVTVPASPNPNASDAVTFTATSAMFPTASRTSVLTTQGLFNAGVSLTTANSVASGLASQAIVYTLNLQNTGNAPDSFTLARSNSGWATSVVPNSTGLLAIGGSSTIVVTVTVPLTATHNAQDFAIVVATSSLSPSVTSSVVLTTTAYVPAQGFSLAPATATKSGTPNQVVVYTLVITNNGLAADSFTLAMSNHGWPTVSSTNSVGPLNFGASASVIVSVTVPASFSPSDVVTMTATSVLFPVASRTSVLTTQGLFSVGSSLTTTNATKSGLASQAVTYTLSLQNTGNAPDSFNLARINSGWLTIIAPSSPVGPLIAGGSTTIVVTVTVPLTATLNAQDVATIKATSVTSASIQSSVVLTTKLQSFSIYLPLVLKNF